jgi:hypothetical protein
METANVKVNGRATTRLTIGALPMRSAANGTLSPAPVAVNAAFDAERSTVPTTPAAPVAPLPTSLFGRRRPAHRSTTNTVRERPLIATAGCG